MGRTQTQGVGSPAHGLDADIMRSDCEAGTRGPDRLAEGENDIAHRDEIPGFYRTVGHGATLQRGDNDAATEAGYDYIVRYVSWRAPLGYVVKYRIRGL